MINFNLPDFETGLSTYNIIQKYKRDYPYIFFNKDDKIASVFGCLKGAIWNGGSFLLDAGAHTKDAIKYFVNFYNNQGIPLRFTFTNPLIEEKHCYDSYCNMIAETAHNGKNEILVVSEVLENYLRKNYPNYKYIRSIIGSSEKPYDPDEKYYMSVMRRNMNNNWEYLDTIPKEHRSKIEFLCNDPCIDNCPRIYSHYIDFAKIQLNFEKSISSNWKCTNKPDHPFEYYTTKQRASYISRAMIETEYLPRGYNQFKLSGRSNISKIIYNVTDYMIKPEYRADMIAILYEAYYKNK